ncbi:MAG TPA: 2'-5' RNA ligase family protein [Acidimicrobiales bacterium]
MTLQFLGTVDITVAVTALTTLEASACEAVLQGRPGRLGRDAVVVPVHGLDLLAEAVRGAMAARGFVAEERPFHGHLTLARLRGAKTCGLAEEISDRWPVTSVSLVRSHLGGGPAHYETIAETALQPT